MVTITLSTDDAFSLYTTLKVCVQCGLVGPADRTLIENIGRRLDNQLREDSTHTSNVPIIDDSEMEPRTYSAKK